MENQQLAHVIQPSTPLMVEDIPECVEVLSLTKEALLMHFLIQLFLDVI